MDINELLEGDTKLATLPVVFGQLKEAIDDPDCSFDDIGDIISVDPALTVRLLKIVNSAFYGFSSQVETVTHSLTIIGTDQLTQLVLASSVMSRFRGIPEDLLNVESFWRHSIACGLAARSIAALSGEYNVERFFVAGLLHDIGRLMMCLKVPDKVREVLQLSKQDGEPLFAVEEKVFGFHHADAGGALINAWNLPERLGEAIVCHHHPARAVNYPEETAVVNLANAIAHTLQLGDSGEIVPPPMEPRSWEVVGLPESLYLPMIQDKIGQQFDEVADLFLQFV